MDTFNIIEPPRIFLLLLTFYNSSGIVIIKSNLNKERELDDEKSSISCINSGGNSSRCFKIESSEKSTYFCIFLSNKNFLKLSYGKKLIFLL